MSPRRFVFILFNFFSSFVVDKLYLKNHTGVLQVEVSEWQSWRATWRFSPTMAARMQ